MTMESYQDCLDRLYYTTTTDAGTGLTRKDAYKKLQDLVDMYNDTVNYPTKLESEVERLLKENERLESLLYGD